MRKSKEEMTREEKLAQEKWEAEVDSLFEVLDPKNGHSQEESDKAVEKFFDDIEGNTQQVVNKGENK